MKDAKTQLDAFNEAKELAGCLGYVLKALSDGRYQLHTVATGFFQETTDLPALTLQLRRWKAEIPKSR